MLDEHGARCVVEALHMALTSDHPLAPLFARPIAHRGLHERAAGRIENSHAAFAAAIAEGYGIECDVQRSADGHAMVFHDFTLDRLTAEQGPIDARTAADLEAIAIVGVTDRIIRLEALLALVDGQAPLIVAIKSRFDADMRLAETVAATIAGYSGPLGLKSFDPSIVAHLRGLTDMPRGIVGMNDYSHAEFALLSAGKRADCASLGHLGETQADFLSWRALDLIEAAPIFAKAAPHLPLMSWTIRSPAAAEAALQHADQIVFEGFYPSTRSAETEPDALL